MSNSNKELGSRSMVTLVQRVLLVWAILSDFIQSDNPFAFDWSFPFQTFRTRIDRSALQIRLSKWKQACKSRMESFSETNNCVLWVVITKRGEMAAFKQLVVVCIIHQMCFSAVLFSSSPDMSVKYNYEKEMLL